MFGIAPKTLNTIDVVFGLIVYKSFGVIHHQMFTVSLQRLISTKRIGVIDRSLAGMRLDMSHERFCRDRLINLGINPSIPLQQAEYDAFSSRTTTALPLADSTKVRLVQFDLAGQLSALQLGNMEQRLAQPLIDSRNSLGIYPQITRQPVGRLLLVKPLQDGNLAAQLGKALLLAAARAFYIASCGLRCFERTAKNALAAIQKVGRTTKYCMKPCNHKYLQKYYGYETP